MEASKWLKVQALVDASEMQDLFHTLGDFKIYVTGTITPRGEGSIGHAKFLEAYKSYVEDLKNRRIPDEGVYRHLFSSVFTISPEFVNVMPIGEERQLIKVLRPVIQLQAHHLDYSIHDGKFRPMVFGIDSVTWGLQFSYPQLFKDSISNEVLTVTENENFPNTRLFHDLQRWIRRQTIPTPFIVENKKINVPMRLGKQCLSWINEHPQLKAKRLTIGA